MADKLDCVVVGAGVVGLAIARSLGLAGREVVVLEAESRIGMHSSSRNSEVIHAGLYYPEDSLKARLCVAGKKLLYEYCNEHRIGCDKGGKLIVAAAENDLDRLAEIKAQATRNGVVDLQTLGVDEMRELEPEVKCVGALLSPSTGIVDSHALMTALQGDVEAQGGAVVLNSRVADLIANSDRFEFEFEVGGESFACKTLVNAAGLGAQELVATLSTKSRLKPLPQTGIPPLHLAKGHYFAYPGKSPFRHSIYPLPFDGGLGIHATNDLAGAVRFGPDVAWVDSIDYDFDESRKSDFVTAIRSYFPNLDEDKLVPGYTGIRSKLVGPGASFQDFVIQGEADHGVPGLVNVFGIESPGLTACLAIGEYVEAMLAS